MQCIITSVRKTVSKKKLFERNDRIIVGLSGGKDSTVLLDILHKIERKYPSDNTITLDEAQAKVQSFYVRIPLEFC